MELNVFICRLGVFSSRNEKVFRGGYCVKWSYPRRRGMKDSGRIDGRKVEAGTPRSAWLARVGTWVRTEVEPAPMLKGAALSFDRDTGLFLLSARMQMPSVFPLKTISDDKAITEGSGRNLGSAIRVAHECGTGILNVFGVRFRKKKQEGRPAVRSLEP